MILTILEVATRLKVPPDTIHRWIRQGKIPVRSSQGTYTIRQDVLESWAAEHKLKIIAPEQAQTSGMENSENLLAAMKRGGFFFEVAGSDKESVLKEAVNLIPNVQAAERDLICAKLIEREQLASTGIGHGIALPHPRSTLTLSLTNPQITTCFLGQPVAFGAIDHRPVRVLLIFLSTSTKQHLTLLSRMAFCLRDPAFRDHLHSLPEPDTVLDRVALMEAQNER